MLAFAVGAWGEHGRGEGHSSHDTNPEGSARYDPESHRHHGLSGIHLRGPAVNAALHEPHCHTIGLGYPTMPEAGLLQLCMCIGGGVSKKPSVPVSLAVLENRARLALVSPLKPPKRFTPDGDSETRIHLLTSRLLL
jgi:hypothetical protein